MSWWQWSQWQPDEWRQDDGWRQAWADTQFLGPLLLPDAPPERIAKATDDAAVAADMEVPVARVTDEAAVVTDEVEPGTASANASHQQSSSAGPHAAPPPIGCAAPAPGTASARAPSEQPEESSERSDCTYVMSDEDGEGYVRAAMEAADLADLERIQETCQGGYDVSDGVSVMAQAGSDSEDSTAERTGEGSRFLTAIPEERASEEEGDGPVREVADGGPFGTRPDPWEEGTRGAPHQSWCQCHMCQPCLDFYAREWGGPLPPGTAGTGEEPSSSRAAVPGTASASPVHRLGTAIGDRPHDRAMRELGPDRREWWLTRSGWWWTRRSPEHDWYPWQGERGATWCPNWY